MYVVFTEIRDGKDVERWYYGTYDAERAFQVARELGDHPADGIYRKICRVEEVHQNFIQNLPSNL